MSDIKESIQEVYGQHKLSQEAKKAILADESTLKNKHKERPRFSWQPFMVSIGLVAILFLFVLTLPNDSSMPYVSSQDAPSNADDQVMERINHFLAIIEDGKITEEERSLYTMTNDWALQLSFDIGKSPFYNRPNVTSQEAQEINTLLARIADFVWNAQPNEMIVSFEKPSDFSSLLQDLSKWNKALEPYSKVTYESSLKEKPISNKEFFMFDWKVQLTIVGFILLFLYLFIQNIRYERNKLFFWFHVIVLFFLLATFFQESFEKVAYDEASLLAILNERYAYLAPPEGLQLLDVAQLGEYRYALAKSDSGDLVLSTFHLNNGRFVIGSTAYTDWGEGATLDDTYSDDSKLIYVVGVSDSNHIEKITLKDEERNRYLQYPINPKVGKIYFLTHPENAGSARWEYKYEEGFEPEVIE